MSDNLRAAVALAERGWLVLPCHHPIGSGCSCRRAGCTSPGKHPRTKAGLLDASNDVDMVTRWWRRWPNANIGIRTGTESGIVVLDVDPDHGGVETLRRLVADHGPLPLGLRTRTGSGGWHLCFAHPGRTVRNSAGRLGPGLDVRGDGGYVIAPPSTHACGGTYRFIDLNAPIPPMPDWLDRLLRPPERAALAEPVQVRRALTAWARSALEREAAHVRNAPEGTRNVALNRAAFNLGQIAAAGIVDPATVCQVLTGSALAAGLGEREIERTVHSGLSAGLRQPRTPRNVEVGHDIAP